MDEEKFAFTAEFGVWPPSKEMMRQSGVEQFRLSQSLRDWQQQKAFVSPGRVALLDNTLLRRVDGLLDCYPGEACSAEGLFALNTWLIAVVFYDRIVHLENPDVPPSAWMDDSPVSDAFEEIDCDLHRGLSEARYPGLFAFLDRVHGYGVNTVEDLLSEQRIRQAIWAAWSALLGTNEDRTRLSWRRGPTIDDIRFDQDYQSRWPSPADEITRLLTDPEDSEIQHDAMAIKFPNKPSDLTVALTDSALRTATNHHIATMAGVTYLPSPVRVPVLAALMEYTELKSREVEQRLILRQIRSRAEKQPASAPVLERVEFSLPPLLNVALHGVKSRDQLLEQVGKLRAMAAGCRRVLKEYEVALREPDSMDLDKARDQVNRMWREAETELTSLCSTISDQLYSAAVPAAILAAATLGMFLVPSLSPAFLAGACSAILEYFRDKGIEMTGLFGQGPLKQFTRRSGMFLAQMVDIDSKGLIVPPTSLTNIWKLDTREAERVSKRFQAFSETIAGLNRAST